MNEPHDVLEQIESLARRHGLYEIEAYLYVLEALEQVMETAGVRRHVSGEMLLESIKTLGRDRYGLMATDVFAAWGVRQTLDFGRIVFHMVDAGLLTKRDEDSLGDFVDRYDFRQVFEVEYFEGRA